MDKKILIIEDDQRLAQTLSRGLREKDFDTEIAYDSKIGLKVFNNNKFDLVILDIGLPGGKNGYEVCAEIRQKDSQIPIIMLTALGDSDDKIEGFESGADDYIVKPYDFRELLARVNVFLKRANADNEVGVINVLRAGDLEMNIDTKMVTRSGKKIDLTPKEFGLLEYLIKNKGKPISKTEIAEQVWKETVDSLNVIEVYINFLRKKVDKDFDSKLIQTKTGVGYYVE
jgi:two-component system, OmpR family, copper resistance phosphate regulon response regulator CusR